MSAVPAGGVGHGVTVKRDVGEARAHQDARSHVRTYAVHMAPRGWLGRIVAAMIAVTLVVIALLFFSFLFAVGAFLLALAVAYAVVRSALGGSRTRGAGDDAASGRVFDMEGPSDDDDERPSDTRRP